MITVKFKPKAGVRYRVKARFRKYEKAWEFVAEELMGIDYALYYSQNLRYLCDGYTGKKVFHFGSSEVSRRGIQYKITFK